MDLQELPDLSRPRYDQSTFWGRLRHFLNVTDPRTLLVTDTQLNKAKGVLQDFKEKKIVPAGGVEELYESQKIVNAIVHPTTGEKIFAPFRVSAFVPANLLIAAGLLIPGAGIGTQLFWQVVNQSYNTAMNYANRNGTDSDPSTSDVLKNYGLAVGASCSLSMGLNIGFQKATFLSETSRKFGTLLVPFFAVAGSNFANVVLMRRGEAVNGIEVVDSEGVSRGKSPYAGKQGLLQVAISRVLIPVPVLTIPPIAFHFLNKTTLMQKNPMLSIPVNMALITACLYTGLPAAIALFPQIGELEACKMEERFQNLVDSKGNPITKLYFNKGL